LQRPNLEKAATQRTVGDRHGTEQRIKKPRRKVIGDVGPRQKNRIFFDFFSKKNSKDLPGKEIELKSLQI
jgi:hypothetical protein